MAKVDEANYTPSLKSTNKAAAYSKATGQKPFAGLHAKRKGFDIKRDKGGKGFSMVIQKKIKGFEETEMSGERIDELSKSTLKSAQKGFAKRIATSAKAGDEKKVEKDVSNIAKAGHRLAGRYYPKHVKQRNPTFGGHREYKGAHGEHEFTNPKTGERYERKKGRTGPYKANEEYEIDEQEDVTKEVRAKLNKIKVTGQPVKPKSVAQTYNLDKEGNKGKFTWKRKKGVLSGVKEEYDMNEQEEEEGEEQEVMEPNVSDLVLNAIEQKPLDFQQSFADLMQQRIEDAVAERKLEVAAAFTGDDRSQYETGEDEPEEGEEEEEEGEVEEEPEAEEESDEEEEDEVSSRNSSARRSQKEVA